MSKVFVVSDTWFNRPLDDDPNVRVVDNNELLIHNWNTTVGKSDDVYVLGGFGVSDLYNIVVQLNGRIHFLDNYFISDEREFIELMKENIKKSINPNVKTKVIFEKKQIVVLEKLDVVLSYLPLSDWMGRESGTFCFHGLNENIDIEGHNISCCSHKWQDSPIDIQKIISDINNFEENL